MVHQLKSDEPWWSDILAGRKTFTVRKNDRGGFFVGQFVELKSNRTGGICMREITYVLQGGQHGIADGYVVLGLGTGFASDQFLSGSGDGRS